eukprot:3855451-Amphidinium_carterae.1
MGGPSVELGTAGTAILLKLARSTGICFGVGALSLESASGWRLLTHGMCCTSCIQQCSSAKSIASSLAILFSNGDRAVVL